MPQIADWLERLGLSEYAQRFAENAIDFSVLSELTDQDLKDIGVILGHRRKMLAAIRQLTEATRSPSDLSASPRPRDIAERRQVTVMFSDLVGSTALSARMDPEDLREIIAAYQSCVSETVRRFGGFVAQYLGDGVLAYFGYPQAHEDDAERAVRAAIELIAAVAALKQRTALQTRVGIATGLVVVGDLGDAEGVQEHGIVGETPNLAARLQTLALPNSVVIAESTRHLLGNIFELNDLGMKNLKGITGPVRVWEALRESSVASRFEALRTGELTDLVGREEETEMLLRRWARAKSGEGQVALLCGEAGIGKSRLTAALLQHLAGEVHTRLRYFCSPQHTDSTLYPIISQMERAAGFARDDSPRQKLDKLGVLLAQTATSPEDAALFADVLSLPHAGSYPASELTPEQRRQKTLEAIVDRIEALARKSPLLMVVEDAHWIDPTSLEVFARVMDRVRNLRALLILTFRPEFTPAWVGRPHVTALTLNRLAQRDTQTMIDRVVGDKLLPASVRQHIIERTDGIPLFVEEMTKAVLEAGHEDASRRSAAGVASPALAVPASLHASLMARLDRLGPAKQLAQIGAAIGREFAHALLADVADKPESELNSALDRLIDAGLLFRQGMPPHANYLFKHALVQDAAYSSLLREARRSLHARIAEAIEHNFAEIAENKPELLARHCAEAGLIETAAGLWGKAAQRSLERSALVEAAEQLTRALGQLAALPPTPSSRREEIRLQVALITPLTHIKGYAAPETKAATERARQLIEQAEKLGEPLENPLLLFSVLYGFWVANFVAFNGNACRDLAAQFLALAEKDGATVPRMVGHRLVGTSLMCTGNIVAGRKHYDQSLALYDPARHRALAMRFGQDVAVAIEAFRSIGLWMLGHPAAALAEAHSAIADARNIGQAASLMVALCIASFTAILSGSYSVAAAQSDEVIRLADDKGALIWKANGTLNRGCILALTGQAADAIYMLTAGLEAFRSTGTSVFVPFFLGHLARAYADLGQFGDASRCIREAMTTVETTEERWCEPEIYRVAGEIALMTSQTGAATAEGHFRRALAVAREQQARSWELRAAMSMARLKRDQGRLAEAREVLVPLYDSFTEGFDTLDLKDAKALLDEWE